MRKILFIGGPGNISASFIERSIQKGDSVGVYTHSRRTDKLRELGVRVYPGDRDDRAGMEHAVREFMPEVVVDTICFLPDQARQTAEILAGRVSQYLFVSTVDVYGYPLSALPMPEDGEFRPPIGSYPQNKLACETLLAGFGDHLPLTIVRPSYSMGDRFAISAFSRDGGRTLMSRLRAGLPIVIPGDGTTLLHAGTAVNAGYMMERIAGDSRTIGQSFTLAHHALTTHDEYVHYFARILGTEARIVHIPTDLLLHMDDPDIQNSILPVLTKFNIAFSTEKFRRFYPDFIWEQSLDEAISSFIQHHDILGDLPAHCGYDLEDRLAAAWTKSIRSFIGD